MRLRLKEDPKEWGKLAWLCCGMLLLVTGVLYWRGVISAATLLTLALLLGGLAFMAWKKPEMFRPFYRAVMTVSFRCGQTIGKGMLGLVYILVVTPLGLILRMSGMDLLRINQSTMQKTYWKQPRRTGKLDQQF